MLFFTTYSCILETNGKYLCLGKENYQYTFQNYPAVHFCLDHVYDMLIFHYIYSLGHDESINWQHNSFQWFLTNLYRNRKFHHSKYSFSKDILYTSLSHSKRAVYCILKFTHTYSVSCTPALLYLSYHYFGP